jgi:hypothetical protein
MERAVEIFAAVNCLVIGLSHVARPRDWVDFFIWLRGKGHAGVFVNGFLSLGFGSVIVAFHTVWQGLPAVLTVFGWMQVAKGLLCLVFPQLAMRSLARVSPDRSREFVTAGIVSLALSGVFGYLAFAR